MPIRGKVLYPFRWFFRPESSPFISPAEVPVVRILERPELAPEQIPDILREINDRQWGALQQIMIEAKFKAEAMLRDDSVMSDPGRVAFYQGWVSYSDYIISSLDRLRGLQSAQGHEPEPGPE